MKKIMLTLLALLLVLPVVSGAQQGVQGKKVSVGSFLPMSGPVAFIGRGVREGMDTYIKYFNQEIKTGGYNFEGFFMDDAFEAAKSISIVRDLSENKKVFAIVGAVGTPGILGSLEFIKRKGIPFVYQGSGVSELYDPPVRNVFPVQPSYVGEGRLFGKFIAEHLKKKKIAYVFQRDAGVIEAAEGTKKGMNEMIAQYRRQGLRIVGEIPFGRADSDLSPVANRIKQLDPDVVVIFAMGSAAVGIVKSAREAGIDLKKIPFVTTYVNSDPIFFKLAGDMWNDVFIGAWAKPDSGDYFKNFMRVWKKYSGTTRDPSPYNIAGWIAMEVFAEGFNRMIKKFGTANWNNYISAMETFHEGGGWSDGMAYKLAYKKFDPKDKLCRYPQNYQYFIVGVDRKYQLYKKAKNLEDLFMAAY